jgi:arylsulfatase A
MGVPLINMDRRSFLPLLAGGLLRGASATRPNILIVLADDLGWRDFGIYGNAQHETPEVDQLAKESSRFSNAYAACPVCSPTRASILTGKYPARLHLTDWIPGRAQWPAARLLTPQFEQGLPLSEPTIAERLKPLGYRTAAIGKWHLGGGDLAPAHRGFDVTVGGDQRGGVSSYFGPFTFPGLENTSRQDYITDRLTGAAEAFLTDSAQRKTPFFLYFAHYAVHIPLQVPEGADVKYRAKAGVRSPVAARYAALVETVDVSLGRLRRKLDELGLARNTIVIVTSDNGGLRYEGKSHDLVTDNSPLRAGKGHLYEGGIREPLIVYWPGVTRPAAVIDTPVSSVDLLPTILEMAGGRAPGVDAIDGVSLASLLKGGRAPKRDAIYWHYPHYSNQGGVPGGAVRSGDWKLIEFYEDRRLELYNLRDDVGEHTNLASMERRRTEAMRYSLDRWRQRVKASMPRLNPAYDPAHENQGLTGAEAPTVVRTSSIQE